MVIEDSIGTDFFTLDADGDVVIAENLLADTLSLGGASEQVYNAIGGSTASHTAGSEIEDAGDLFVTGAVEIDGLSFFDDRVTITAGNSAEYLRFSNSGTADTIGFFLGNASPESTVTAQLGSLYVDHASGLAYVKTIGDNNNTGWAAVLTTNTGITTATGDERYVKKQGDTMT